MSSAAAPLPGPPPASSGGTLPAGASGGATSLQRLLGICVARDASDIHLIPGLAPHFRVHGELCADAALPVLTETDLQGLAEQLARELSGAVPPAGGGGATATPPVDLRALLAERGSLDGALSSAAGTDGRPGVRFRFNLFRRQGRLAIALRRLEERFRTLNELGLPDSLYQLCNLRDGLVIISGPTGAGKSTTLASLIDRINQERSGHIITIEDPIEYLHLPRRCVVNQRQVGLDAPNFNEALVAALRQDPDFILVGEIRDLETIRTAIVAAETGHLVFTTLHAGDCVGSIERLIAVFPAGEQDGVRRQLSLVLRGVIAQHLAPQAESPSVGGGATPTGDPRGRVAVAEILLVTTAIANLIATGRAAQIYSAMETGQNVGMQTLEQDLARKLVAGRIAPLAARALARNPAILQERITALQRPKASGLHERRS